MRQILICRNYFFLSIAGEMMDRAIERPLESHHSSYSPPPDTNVQVCEFPITYHVAFEDLQRATV